MIHHLSGCVRSWGCFTCMAQYISDQNAKVIRQPPAGVRPGGQQKPCGFSQPLCAIALCSHLSTCRQVGMLLPDREVHWETHLPGWMVQCSTGRMLVAPAELCMALETFLRNMLGLLWKRYLLILCWDELMLLKTRIKWLDAVLKWGRDRSQPELFF